MKPILIDSNIVFIATGQIGEAWAVVILEQIAEGVIPAATTVLYLQELLEVYYSNNKYYNAKQLFKNFQNIVPHILEMSVEDFDKSMEYYLQEPSSSPRECLAVSCSVRFGICDILSVDGPSFAPFSEVKAIPLSQLLAKLNLPARYIEERFFKKQKYLNGRKNV